ncbi:MAG TPA: 4Fe-4S dicluster domain-containing protein [Bryobacteraceae bacterium]|nr:4Fe-4S dicluster domain-containing protein [Bryobacteraceae bacterium]
MKTEKQPLWRSLDEFAHPPAAGAAAGHELAWRDSDEVAGMDRREFWKVMGAAMAMAGATGCVRQPPEKIVPYVNQPTEVVQGEPLFFATAMPHAGDALGLLVKSHMGHPVKVEGNPQHPSSLGGTDVFAQASLMTLYDPDRSQTVMQDGRVSDWIDFLGALAPALQGRGPRLRLLTGTVISPTEGAQIQAVLARFPGARWHQWEPAGRDHVRAGAQMAFGQAVNTHYHFERADVIFALDADFLSSGPAHARHARDFASRRGTRTGAAGMNRLYAAETWFTNTGASADHRFPLKPSEMEPVLRAIAQAAGAPGGAPVPSEHARWLNPLIKDLLAHRGASAGVVGEAQPAHLHALAHSINAALGNAGRTVVYTDSNEVGPTDQLASFRELVADMHAGKVDTLIITGVNPAYDAPADLGFRQALERVHHTVHHGLHFDETGILCDWHVPATMFLEEWSDCTACDGTASIIQPLIAPLYQGRSRHQLLAAMLGQGDAAPYDLVRETWRGRNPAPDFEEFWRACLHDGVVAGTAFPERTLTPRPAPEIAAAAQGGGGWEIQFRPDPTVLDGRFANNPYLQELPKPITKLTWDAVAMVSPKTAEAIGAGTEAVVELDFRGRKTEFPLWVQPGHADGCVTVILGYGRKHAGRVGRVGYNAYPLRTADALWSGRGLRVRPTGKQNPLATTQAQHSMEGRYPVRLATLAEFRKDPDFAHKEPFEETPPRELTIYREWRYDGYKWGMSIDLNACMGCNACVMACNAENNIAVVGKNEVRRGRIMHWLRIDRYYHGQPVAPHVLHQPNLCMHCENAPCELVCPVNATVHSAEGLNQMVYNRCVGTRYCSNNCPYKVRRFNFFLYTDWNTPSYELMRNPEVTPRSRGVMEKCTYCVQRIERAKIKSQIEDRTVRDGEIVTACQQACPTQAIVFGNLNDPNSRVVGLKKQAHDYQLLGELNTRPRTTYLARIFNPNPELEGDIA